MKTPEEILKKRIEKLVNTTLKKLPVPKLWTLPLKKYVDVFVDEIVDMSNEYVTNKLDKE
jgi:hypothetical protein